MLRIDRAGHSGPTSTARIQAAARPTQSRGCRDSRVAAPRLVRAVRASPSPSPSNVPDVLKRARSRTRSGRRADLLGRLSFLNSTMALPATEVTGTVRSMTSMPGFENRRSSSSIASREWNGTRRARRCRSAPSPTSVVATLDRAPASQSAYGGTVRRAPVSRPTTTARGRARIAAPSLALAVRTARNREIVDHWL